MTKSPKCLIGAVSFETLNIEYQEVIIPDCGHSPHIEKPEAFREALLKQ